MAATTFHCPECHAMLKTANPIPAGRKIKCPKCGSIFGAPAADGHPAAGLQAKPRPQAPAVRKPGPPAAIDEATPRRSVQTPDAEIDDQPPQRPSHKTRPVADAEIDDEELPRPHRKSEPKDLDAEIDDEAPRRPLRKTARKTAPEDDYEDDETADYDDDQADDYEDDEDYEARPKRKSFPKRKKTNVKAVVWTVAAASTLIILLAIGGVLGFVWPGFFISYSNRGTGNENPLAYIPADSTLIMSIDGGTWMSFPSLATQIQKIVSSGNTATRQDLFSDCKTNTGIELNEMLDRVVIGTNTSFANQSGGRGNAFPQIQGMPGAPIVFQANTPPPGPPQGTVAVFKSKVPFDQKKVAKFLKKSKNFEVQKYAGKYYYWNKAPVGPGFPYLFMPSDQIMVLSNLPKDKMEALVASDGTQVTLPPDVTAMANRAAGSLVGFVVPISDSMRQNMEKGLKNDRSTPPELKPATEAMTQAKAVGLWLALDNNKARLTFGVTCADEADAKKVTTALEKFYKSQTTGLAGLKIRGALVIAPKSIQQLAKELLDSAKFVNEGALAQAWAEANLKTLQDSVADASQFFQNMMKLQQGAAGGMGGFRPNGPGFQPGGGFPGGAVPGQPPARPRQPGR